MIPPCVKLRWSPGEAPEYAYKRASFYGFTQRTCHGKWRLKTISEGSRKYVAMVIITSKWNIGKRGVAGIEHCPGSSESSTMKT